MSIVKAIVTDVALGGELTIQGLMSDNGDFGIAVPQLSDYLQIDSNQASRSIKALLGAGFQFDKWASPLHPKAVNVIDLNDFTKLVLALHRKGNKLATVFVEAMVGLSLHQLFCDAFHKKCEAEDRQRYLETRLTTKHDFRELTDLLKLNGFKEPHEYSRYVWAFQSKLGIESGTRDHIDMKKLVQLERAQVKLTTLMECGVSPWDALKRI